MRSLALAGGLIVVACRNDTAGSDESNSSTGTSETGDESGDGSTTASESDSSTGNDIPDPGADDPELQLIIALGQGSIGETAFGEPYRFDVDWSIGVTGLVSNSGRHLVRWSDAEICLADLVREGDLLSLNWRRCRNVGALWDAARLDANADGIDELMVLKRGGNFASYTLDPGLPSGMAEPVIIPNPTPWTIFTGMTVAEFDGVPGDEVIASGLDGDPVLGSVPSTVIIHGGAAPVASMAAEIAGSPNAGNLTDDALPDLLMANTILRGTGDTSWVEWMLQLNTSQNEGFWVFDANDDSIDDIGRILVHGDDCSGSGQLEVRLGPILLAQPEASVLEGTGLDARAAQLVGDLDHDGRDEIVSVGVGGLTCPSGGEWTVTSTQDGGMTSSPIPLCENDCSLVAHTEIRSGYNFPLAASLVDLDGDDNLDLAVLVELQ